MIGHFSGMTLAVGVDHIIYGWLFFGLVMFIMFWIGSFWREDAAPPAPRAPLRPAVAAGEALVPAPPARIGAMAAAVVALAALWPAFAAYNDQANLNPRPVRLALAAPSWPAATASGWHVHYMEPDARADGAWRSSSGLPVELSLLYYRNQGRTKSLVSSLNRLAGYNDSWHELDATLRSEQAGARSVPVREATLQGPSGKLLVWSTMWIDGRYTASNVAAKLWQARAKLLFHGDDGALVVLAAPYSDDVGAGGARSALRAFLAANGGAIDTALADAHHN
jgi:EpsI family protein